MWLSILGKRGGCPGYMVWCYIDGAIWSSYVPD